MPRQHFTSQLPAFTSLVMATPKTDLSQVVVVICHPLSRTSGLFCRALAMHGLEVHVCATYPELYPEAATKFVPALGVRGRSRVHIYARKETHPEGPHYAKLYAAIRQARANHKCVLICDYNGSLLRWLWQHQTSAQGGPLIQGISSIRPQSLKIYQDHHRSTSSHEPVPILTLPHHLLHAEPQFSHKGKRAFKATKHWITAWNPDHALTDAPGRPWKIAVVGYEDGGRAVSCELATAAHRVMVAASSLTEQARACYDGHVLLPAAGRWPQDLTHLVWTYPQLDGFATLASELPHGAIIINGSGMGLDTGWPLGTQDEPSSTSGWRIATLLHTSTAPRQLHVRDYPAWGDPLADSPQYQDLVYYFEWTQLFSLIHHLRHHHWDPQRAAAALHGPATLPVSRQYALCAEVLATYGAELNFLASEQKRRLNTDGTYTPWHYRHYGPNHLHTLP